MMVPTPINVVKMTTLSLTPAELEVHGFIGLSFRVIQFVHRIWYWFQRFELYRNPDNFLKLAAGHSLNWLVGDKTMMRIAAQAVLIGARIIDNVKEQKALIDESKKFWIVVTDPYTISRKVKFSHDQNHRWISPSTAYQWSHRMQKIMRKIKQIAHAVFSITKRLFILSMRTMDVMEAFSYGAQLRNQSLNEIFINSSKCLEELVKNRELLLGALKKNRTVITAVLRNSGSLFTADQLIHAVQKTMQVTEKVHRGIEGASKKVGVFGNDLLKRAVFGIFQSAGLTQIMPKAWVPAACLIGMQEKNKLEERFPSRELVTWRPASRLTQSVETKPNRSKMKDLVNFSLKKAILVKSIK